MSYVIPLVLGKVKRLKNQFLIIPMVLRPSILLPGDSRNTDQQQLWYKNAMRLFRTAPGLGRGAERALAPYNSICT